MTVRFVSLLLLLLLAAPRIAVSFVRPTGIYHDTPRITESAQSKSTPTIFQKRLDSRRFVFDQRAESWILLVDDEEPIRRAVGDFFVDQGYRVTTCADGEQALELAQSQIPDCIVSDIRMPVMDGLELLEIIRSSPELEDVPVVLLSAKAMVQDRIAGYDAGADAYLTKPFSPEELVAMVDNLVQRSRNLQAEHEDLYGSVTTHELVQDLAEIKDLLTKGGGGIGNGWVRKTDVFLSSDERAVLELISKGLMTKEIASQTHLSTRRIEQLLTGMFRKTGVKNRTELVRWAVSTGNVE